jgi:Lar family restriction alleviation protein
MDNLKSCPFCGGEAELRNIDHIGEWLYEARCPYWGCGTDYCDTEAEATEAWNRRNNNG